MKKEDKKNKEKSKKTQDIQGSLTLEISSSDVLVALLEGYGSKDDKDAKKRFEELLSGRLKQIITKYSSFVDCNILILFDNTTMVKGDSDRIYQAVSSLEKNKKPLLLVLVSNGGEPGSAYLIGKLCRESSNNKFIVSVPRHAKSAATLLSCAADEIHMGSLSELGPIDPQIKGMPALGLKDSIDYIANLVCKSPESSEMFAKYLSYSVEPIQIGYYERATKSAEQYAEKLLRSRKQKVSISPKDTAYKLVHEYKDHGFVIDKSEAKNVFGEEIVKENSAEYNLGNEIYLELSKIGNIAENLDFYFYFIGSVDSKPQLVKKDRK